MTDIQHFATLIKDIKFAMFTTFDPNDGLLHSRPMTLQESEFDGDLWFFADKNSEWVSHIVSHSQVNVSFSNPKDMSFLSAMGHAQKVEDRQKMEELWKPVYKAWFPEGLESPSICLIKVHVESADFWESPNSKIVQMLGFAKAAVTGKQADDLGQHGHINF